MVANRIMMRRLLLASLVASLARADVLMFGARFGPTGTASSFATGMCEPAMLATLPTFESESQQREAVCKKYGKENFAFKEIKEAKETVCACVTCVEPQAPVCPPTGDWEPDKGKPDRCFKVVVSGLLSRIREALEHASNRLDGH